MKIQRWRKESSEKRVTSGGVQASKNIWLDGQVMKKERAEGRGNPKARRTRCEGGVG